jgi:hypothetical protein
VRTLRHEPGTESACGSDSNVPRLTFPRNDRQLSMSNSRNCTLRWEFVNEVGRKRNRLNRSTDPGEELFQIKVGHPCYLSAAL